MKRNFLIFFILLITFQKTFSQPSTYVDENGIFRWIKTKNEIRIFGVNYTLPFAHGYRSISFLGKNHKNAIDKDIYHIARLGISGYRVHIWDAEVTDSLGNLLVTPQLNLLDYTLAKLKERNIKTIITPIKIGGNGYPEKDQPAPGFSNNLEKQQTYSDKEIISKQKRYLTQLLNHINPYTKIAYKNDPDIIAIEITNEPLHDNEEIATQFINTLVSTIKNAGFQNPIFYNVSEKSKLIDAYLNANIDGCTFQWYPTGLVQNTIMPINFLPNVNKYDIPFLEKPKFLNKARIIYEFDPGDTNASTLYPAMARSFRQAKFQFAAQFAYDAIELAHNNTEYQTHYLNLAYTPAKAISLKIASEVFMEVNTSDDFGSYPYNTNFKNTQLFNDENLAVYNTETQFFYTNTNKIQPKNIKALKHIAGIGNSEIVKYSGNGAYFLDKVDNGIWRLEIMPDVLWVDNPFEKASWKKTVAVLKENEQTISVDLPELSKNISFKAINDANTFGTKKYQKNFNIIPGVYLIYANELPKTFNTNQKIGNITLNEYAKSDHKIDKVFLVHEPKKYIEKGHDLEIMIQSVAPKKINKVEVVVVSGYLKTDSYNMTKTNEFTFTTTIPENKIYNQTFKYYILIHTNDGITTFPESNLGQPNDWDFLAKFPFETEVVFADKSIVLFDASDKNTKFLWPNLWNILNYKIETVTKKSSPEKELKITSDHLKIKIPDLTFKILLPEAIKRNLSVINSTEKLVVHASSGNKSTQKVQIALQLKNSKVFGKTITLLSQKQEISIPYQDLVEVPLVLLPRPYPDFQPYFFQSKGSELFNPIEIEAIQISVGPNLTTEEINKPQELIIESITLQ